MEYTVKWYKDEIGSITGVNSVSVQRTKPGSVHLEVILNKGANRSEISKAVSKLLEGVFFEWELDVKHS